MLFRLLFSCLYDEGMRRSRSRSLLLLSLSCRVYCALAAFCMESSFFFSSDCFAFWSSYASRLFSSSSFYVLSLLPFLLNFYLFSLLRRSVSTSIFFCFRSRRYLALSARIRSSFIRLSFSFSMRFRFSSNWCYSNLSCRSCSSCFLFISADFFSRSSSLSSYSFLIAKDSRVGTVVGESSCVGEYGFLTGDTRGDRRSASSVWLDSFLSPSLMQRSGMPPSLPANRSATSSLKLSSSYYSF